MNKLLSISLSACLLAACSTNNDPLPVSSQAFSDVLIQPAAGIAPGSIEAETRAITIVDGGTATTPELMLNFAVAHDTKTADPVFYGAYGASFTAKRASATGSTATTLTDFSKAQYYLANGRQSKMTGWYPVGTYTQGKVVWTIDGDDDVMVAPAKEGKKNSAMPALAFVHKLAQVQVYAYATDVNAKDLWGNITKVELTGQNKTCTYTFTSDATGAVTFSTVDNATFTLYNNSTGIEPGTSISPVLIGTAMIEPKTSATLNLIVNTKQSAANVPVTVDAREYKASNAYKITLKLDKATITPKATVGGWTNTSSTDKEVTL